MRYFCKKKIFPQVKTNHSSFSFKKYCSFLFIIINIILIILLYNNNAFVIQGKKFEKSEEQNKIISEKEELSFTSNLEFISNFSEITFIKNEEELLEELTIPEPYTKHDLELLTTMVYCENGGVEGKIEINGEEGDACTLHRWTAQVCLNHLKNENINVSSIYEALYYPRYPSYYRESETAQRCREENYERWLDCEQDCLMAMNGLVDLPENVIYASNFADLGSGYFAKIHVKTDYVDTWCYFAYE